MFRRNDSRQELAPSADSIVQIEDVHKSFVMGKEAVPALRGVSLDVKRGEILCLMGPSGSGKTTMLNIIGGLDTPSRGHVLVDGNNVVSLSEERLAALRLRKMGFVFQNFNLLSSFTALEKAVLKAARELTARPNLSDETYKELKQGLDNERIVDLLMVISFYCGVVRLLAALQIDVEEDYEKYLKEFPLPG